MGKLPFKIGLQTLLTVVILGFFPLTTVHAQSAVDIKTEFRQMELQGTQQVSPSPSQDTVQTQPKTINQNQTNQNQAPSKQENFDELQNKIRADEDKPVKNEDSRVNNWLNWWWQIGFWVGILWLFPWVFVGWQWTHFKFWGFGWPWPWWFWIPLFWFIPWVWIGWMWWLDWWVWWMWIWWVFPWVFWTFWWIIIFKESSIWQWHRRGSHTKETG